MYFALDGEIIIRPEKFGEIKTALATAGFIGLTTYEVKGRQKGIVLSYIGKIGN